MTEINNTWKEKSFEEIWDNIEKNFDWCRVHTAMQALDWVWTPSESVPSIKEMKKTAKELLLAVYAEETTNTGTGGFYASSEDGEIGLEFSLSGYNYDEEP